MCILKERFKESKTYTGYKVAYKKGGKYYSPATGIEYREKMDLPDLTKRKKLPKRNFNSPFISVESMACPASTIHRKDMRGRTAVFTRIKDTKHIGEFRYHSYGYENYVILRMTITKALMTGIYEGVPVIAGRRIVKIEELKNE